MCLKTNQNECFDTLHDFLLENHFSLDEKYVIKEHLKGVGKPLETSSLLCPVIWTRNPSEESTILESRLSVNENEQLLEIKNDFQLQKRWKSCH